MIIRGVTVIAAAIMLAGCGSTAVEHQSSPSVQPSQSVEAKKGPASVLMPGLYLPESSTMTETKAIGKGTGERWSVPLSFEDANAYVVKNWAGLGSIRDAQRDRSKDDDGIDTNGQRFHTYAWTKLSPAHAVLISVIERAGGRTEMMLGEFQAKP
jgi:hypothetical protein